jgi:transcriptional antiterminator Rof (Rho-off)
MVSKRRARLEAELSALETELAEGADLHSEAQDWHKRARVEAIKKELAQMDSESKADKFRRGTMDVMEDTKRLEDEKELARKKLFQYNSGNRAA